VGGEISRSNCGQGREVRIKRRGEEMEGSCDRNREGGGDRDRNRRQRRKADGTHTHSTHTSPI
jgi:hypothetical protein